MQQFFFCHDLKQCFQPFSSRESFETLLSIWQNRDTHNNANLRILTEHSEEWVEPLGSAEPRLKKKI